MTDREMLVVIIVVIGYLSLIGYTVFSSFKLLYRLFRSGRKNDVND